MPATRSKNNNGFTLIELLFVIALLGVIALAIYSTLASGVMIWQAVNVEVPEEEVLIFFDKFTRDIKNCTEFTNIQFLGDDDNLRFATLVTSNRLQKRTVGEVIYFYDSNSEKVNREQRDFAHVYSDKSGLVSQSLAEVGSFKFKYYSYDELTLRYVWDDTWEGDGLPIAVRMELEITHGDKTSTYSKTVSIPVSG